jgi:hypothetical protein
MADNGIKIVDQCPDPVFTYFLNVCKELNKGN